MYDIKFYSSDNRNINKEEVIFYNSKVKPTLIESKIPHEGSPGSKNPAVLAYDPTGLRSSMTATWGELDKALEKAKPNHLPHPFWWKELAAVDAEREKKGLPFAVGKRLVYDTPERYNQISW